MREHYKLPTREEVMSRFAGATVFSKLDASSGFWQLNLDNESSDLCTFNTQFGRYRYLRLPFGISSAPEIYHRTIHQMVEHVDGVDTSMDDIIIWGSNVEEHDQRLHQVLQVARQNNLKLRMEKCEIRVQELTFLGDTISVDGIKPDQRKVQAINNMEKPTNRKELQCFLGMVNYLARFLPNLSVKTEPLRKLLEKKNRWEWHHEHDKAFEELKHLVCSEPVLAMYNPKQPIRISTDASRSGLGAVLEQQTDGHWLPVAYHSRALTDAESRYAVIELETLAIATACERFHQYIYGQRVEINTDHKPLVAIFSKPLNDCPPRIERLRLRLQRYDLHLTYVPGKENYTADTLSRLPNQAKVYSITEADVQVHVEGIMATTLVSDRKKTEIKHEMEQDTSMQKLIKVIQAGWPDERQACSCELQAYWNYRDELCIHEGLIYKGKRIIIPLKLRKEILSQIHAGHMGHEKCKRRARQVVFWPGMNHEIDTLVNQCEACQKHQHQHPVEPLKPHLVPNRPWQKVATDLFELNNQHYIVIVDAYSNYPEVQELTSQSSKSVINAMKTVFARLGIPEEVLSDNGPCYSSAEFASFAKQWDFNHITSSPGFPQSNGLAERTVQTVKNIISKSIESKEDYQMGLLVYRATPLANGFTPAELLMGRKIRSNLPITGLTLNPATPPNVKDIKEQEKNNQKLYHDQHAEKLSVLIPGDRVRVRQDAKPHWKDKGEVLKRVMPRSYNVKTENGAVLRRNRRDLLKIQEKAKDSTEKEKAQAMDLASRKKHQVNTKILDKKPEIKASVGTRTRTGREIKKPDKLSL